jgi:hypothetical protein
VDAAHISPFVRTERARLASASRALSVWMESAA